MGEDARVPTSGPYREIEPPRACRNRVRRLWRYRAPDGTAHVTPVLPDGCTDLIWDGRRLFVAGPDRKANEANLPPGCILTGLRLAPGAARAILGVPLETLTDRRVDLEDLWGPRARDLRHRLAEATASPARALLEAVAMRPGTTEVRMARLFTRLAAGDAPRLAVLARALGMSERTLRRDCLAHFGYGPKTLDRILRLQRLLASAPATGQLTRAALDAGYADASHLVHDARDLTGLAPHELLRRHAR